MKAIELRKQSMADLQKTLEDLLRELFNLRMQQGSGQLSRPSQMRGVRKDIARVRTVMNEMKSGSAS